MRRSPESFAAAVRAVQGADRRHRRRGRATRARVLAAAERGARAHAATPRRIALATVVALLVICTASLAGTTLAQRWRRPAEVAIEEPGGDPEGAGSSTRAGHRATVVIPPVRPVAVRRQPARAVRTVGRRGRRRTGAPTARTSTEARPERALAGLGRLPPALPAGARSCPRTLSNRALPLPRAPAALRGGRARAVAVRRRAPRSGYRRARKPTKCWTGCANAGPRRKPSAAPKLNRTSRNLPVGDMQARMDALFQRGDGGSHPAVGARRLRHHLDGSPLLLQPGERPLPGRARQGAGSPLQGRTRRSCCCAFWWWFPLGRDVHPSSSAGCSFFWHYLGPEHHSSPTRRPA